MDKDTRNRIQHATQAARRLLEVEFAAQLESTFDIRPDGTVAIAPGRHLAEDPDTLRVRAKLVEAIAHHRALGEKPADAVKLVLRASAFTTLNRFVALKMLEARKIVQECVSKGLESSGFKNEFLALADGLKVQPDAAYKLYLECLFDEIGREVRVLFDRRDPASLLWPRRTALDNLLGIVNDPELAAVWDEDETIGWVYQYFNGEDERRQMRAESQAPRNSRELAVRNQFFTPRYVVEFLTDNTLGRTWVEMRQGHTRLMEQCRYLVRRPSEVFLRQGEEAPADDEAVPVEQPTVFVPFRAKKDPRELRVLDPACGSGHFLLYSFDLLQAIYEEAWDDVDFADLRRDFPTVEALRLALPGLILRHNLNGVDIDPRAAQIAALALWMRAQRAWNDFGVRRADRPLVTRTNIVVAEPMPGEADLRKEFTASLEPAALGHLVERMFEAMELAGEAGTLLRIEDTLREAVKEAKSAWESRPRAGSLFPELDRRKAVQMGMFDVRAVPDATFWDEAETKVLAALKTYAERVPGGAGYRRRLFAEDAARGFAFIDVCGKRYDVVLMNPPFGQGSTKANSLLRVQYPDTWTDIYGCFMERATGLVPDRGRWGAITSSLFLHTRQMRTLRQLLLTEAGLERFADLGGEVLDGATVSTGLSIVTKGTSSETTDYADFGDLDDKATALLNASAGLAGGGWQIFLNSAFAAVPGMPFCFHADAKLLALWRRVGKVFDPDVGTVATGNHTFDDERFLRLRWEVAPSTISFSQWRTYDKGGNFQPFLAPTPLLVHWLGDGRSLRAVNIARYGSDAQVMQSRQNWGTPGLTFMHVSSIGFSPRVLQRECVFSSESIAVLVSDETANALGGRTQASLALLAVLASTLAQELVWVFGRYRKIENRAVSGFPISAKILGERADELAPIAVAGIQHMRQLESMCLSSPLFFLPDFLVDGEPNLATRMRRIEDLKQVLGHADTAVESLFDLAGFRQHATPRMELVSAVGLREVDTPRAVTGDLIEYSVGSALGRFDLRLATGERPLPPEPDPFDALPACSPGMLTGADGLPLAAPPPDYPIAFPTDGILVDDPGHDRDLLARIHQVFTILFADHADDRMQEAVSILDPSAKDLRPWLRRTFFEEHIQRYSKSRRKAPIYWRVGTPSGSYSVWIYLHRFNKDTLHRVLNDHVAPKLRYESSKLATLQSEAGPSPSPSQRKALDGQETFVDELRALHDEAERVAPLWDPDLDDGVVINASFLHRLFAHTRAWQKECESHWQKLQKGEYDWAHLAMRLWPERVVPKCTDDRSLAIAHGLEDVLWLEGTDGKWRPQPVTDAEIAALVQERTSTAVKDALRRMGETPEPVPARKPRPAVPAGEPKQPKKAKVVHVPGAVQISLGLPGDPTPTELDAVRAALHSADEGLPKAELLAACGLDEEAGAAALAALVNAGEVAKIGAGRGTRYRLNGGAPDADG